MTGKWERQKTVCSAHKENNNANDYIKWAYIYRASTIDHQRFSMHNNSTEEKRNCSINRIFGVLKWKEDTRTWIHVNPQLQPPSEYVLSFARPLLFIYFCWPHASHPIRKSVIFCVFVITFSFHNSNILTSYYHCSLIIRIVSFCAYVCVRARYTLHCDREIIICSLFISTIHSELRYK